MALPPLTLDDWEPTLDTLHLWAQIVGKIRLASTAPKNHWWHVPLYVDVRGLTTRRMHAQDGTVFQIRFDFVDHRLVVETNQGAAESFPLVDGLSVSEFDRKLHETLTGLGIDVAIRENPFGVPMTTPFPDDRDHASYDPDAVERFWRILDEPGAPVLALVRPRRHALRGKARPGAADADAVTQEAYSHELVSFGFWAGDQNVREPSYYAYAAPEPPGMRERPLRPDAANWTEQLALLPYEAVRTADDPRATLLAFLESAYEAGADAGGWNRKDLESSWCP